MLCSSDSVMNQNTQKARMFKSPSSEPVDVQAPWPAPEGDSPALPPRRGAPSPCPKTAQRPTPPVPEVSGGDMPRPAPPQPPGLRAGLPGLIVASRGAGSDNSRVPRGRGGAQTAEPTPQPAGSRTASRAPDAQRATSTATRNRGPRLRARPGSPRAYLPWVPTPPPQPGCEALRLSADAPGLGALTPGWLRPAPAGPAKAPPPVGRDPTPARQSSVLIGSSSHPSR